ncbi:hypothetical protein L226DRAFT_359073 [Lentinus tigrinus ALCF2SS1-7]|uniref:uncharacterized protein n=1 Tax=Lentinus tigrinus ALCF2SS1-7 TaxID=1328758 RepID=UPI001165E998|nr:hypothetical protein L226DRAFT_359073 [Lentinus tigrinus ALCF2SS1-7]
MWRHECEYQGTVFTFGTDFTRFYIRPSVALRGSRPTTMMDLNVGGRHHPGSQHSMVEETSAYRCLSPERDGTAYSPSAGDEGSGLPSPFLHLGFLWPPSPCSTFTFLRARLDICTTSSLSLFATATLFLIDIYSVSTLYAPS